MRNFNFMKRNERNDFASQNINGIIYNHLRVLLMSFVLIIMGNQNVLADVTINSTNFPDANFRNDLLSKSWGKDGIITTAEISARKKLIFNNKGIKNFKGIQYFTSCEELQCNDNSLTSLDISKLTNLTILYCKNNDLESLDVSKNTNLKELYCGDNSNMTSLTLPSLASNSTSTNLTKLSCNGCNLNKITVTNQKNIVDLICFNNKGLKELTGIGNLTKMEFLNVHDCAFSTLNLSSNSKLRRVLCHDNNMTSLTLPTTSVLEHLQCQNNSLTSLDITKQTKLLWFTCGYNKITSIDPTKCTKVWYFACHGNQIESINLSKNTVLRHLSVHSNKKLKELAIPAGCKTTMTSLSCYGNQLTELNLTGFTKLSNSADSVGLSPQTTSISVSSLSNRSIIGIKCNSNNGTLANYGSYTAQTIDGFNYIILAAKGTTGDKNYYKKTIKYNYTTGYTGSTSYAKTMEVNISTSAYVMYVNLNAKKSNNYYYGTICLDYNSTIPSNAKVYIVTGSYTSSNTNNGDLKVSQVASGSILPKGTGFYVEGMNGPGYYPFIEETTKTATTISGNKLIGTLSNKTVAARSVLTVGREKTTGVLGFWNFVGTTIPNHRAYVPVSSLPNSAKENGFAIYTEDEETTAINAFSVETDINVDDSWYTLQGIRLPGKPTEKGIYVNKGKKILVK